MQQSLEHLAALNRTPAVKLLGISPSGFNATGESDIRNYYDHISSQQEKVIRPALEEVFRVLSVHLFGTPDAGMRFEFAPMSENDAAATAMAQQQRAASITALVSSQVISPDEARTYLRNSPDSGFDFLDPEDAPESDMMNGSEYDEADMDVSAVESEPDRPFDVASDEEAWRTTKKGKHYQIDTETGEITKGNVGQNESNSLIQQNIRRNKVEDAMREIANGKSEATIIGLRKDLEQYGGSNDVTIIRGDMRKGLKHIEARHGNACVAYVLEAMANGEIVRFSRGNRTVAVQKDGYEAILSLEEHGNKKTWLLTGYDIFGNRKKEPTGDSGKFCTRHASMHIEPTSSRLDVGAVGSFIQRIEQILIMSIE